MNMLAEENVAKMRFVSDGFLMGDAVARLKSSVTARVRGRLLIALHAAVSSRVGQGVADAEEVLR